MDVEAKMKRVQIVFVLVSVAMSVVEGAAEPDPRGFTEDPLDTEEKFRENGKNEGRGFVEGAKLTTYQVTIKGLSHAPTGLRARHI